MPAATAASRGRGAGVWRMKRISTRDTLGCREGEKGEERVEDTWQKGDGRGVRSPICSLPVGLGEDRLEFDICTSTLLPWPRVPFLLLAKSLSPAASHLQESIHCVDCPQTTAFTALKGLSTAAPGTVCTAEIHHTPFSLPCPRITVFAISQHLWGGWHVSPSRYK